MKYVISVFYDDAEVDVKTNDVEIAILEMLKADKTGNHAHVCDGKSYLECITISTSDKS